MKEGGYKRLKERHIALRGRIFDRFVKQLWSMTREEAAGHYNLLSEFEQAKIASLTGHELRLRYDGARLVCELVKIPSTA